MPDEVTADHSAQNVPAPEAPREIVVTDYAAVPEMIAALQWIHDQQAPPWRKQSLTVIALHRLIVACRVPDPRAAKQVLDLLPSKAAKFHRDLMCGMVAAAVAWLRAAAIDEVSCLDGLLKTNQPFVLGFTPTNARRWFYNVKETLDGKKNPAPPVTVDVFKLMAPAPVLLPTQDEAKEQARGILQAVRFMNPKPLAGKRRPR